MDEKRKKKLLWQLPFLLLLIVGTILIIRQQQSLPFHHSKGMIFGTFYSVTYQSDKNLDTEIEATLKKVDDALSMFNKRSVISRINQGSTYIDKTEEGLMFKDVYLRAMKISEETDGAFDITVAPLVNAWGFGFKTKEMPGKYSVDSLLQFVGYKKQELFSDEKGDGIHKKDARMMLDCSAIAKGYGTDAVAQLLMKNDIRNFMVEIGGEVVTKGINPNRVPWKIGVIKPTDDSLQVSQELQTVLNITDRAMATSGNYRNFYYQGGKKYAHTIDPRTGYPVQHSLLSATVLTDNCTDADAYATAFMVIGLEKTKKFLEKHPELMAYLIYANPDGSDSVWYSPTLKEKVMD